MNNSEIKKGNPPFSIRSVAQEDYSEWKVLWDEYNAFYGRKEQTSLPLKITEMTWSRFFDAYEPVHALVAVKDGRLIGLAHYLYHRSTIQIEPHCYLQDLFTADSSRGLGIGRALIDKVCEQAKLAGSRRVYWQTHKTNEVAMRLYDKVAEQPGFIVYRISL